MKRISLIFAVLAITLISASCVHHYTPRSSTYDLDAIDEFTSPDAIAIINGQPSDEDFLVVEAGIHEHFGKLSEWTEAAVEVTERELAERGMQVTDAAQKRLTLTITTASSEFGMWVIRTVTYLKVETGNGYTQVYTGDNRSPSDLMRSIDGAIMRSVAEMLRDPEIVDYLTAKSPTE